MHYLVCGVTLSGKTTLAHWVANSLAAEKDGPEIIVYDPVNTPTMVGAWPEDAIVFDDKPKFLKYVEALKPSENGYAIFIDEADLILSHEQRENHWLLTKGRHFGFDVWVITQRHKMVSPSVRGQCGVAYVFRLSRDDLRNIGNDFAHDVADINLDRGDYLLLESGTARMERGNIFSQSKGKRWKPTSSKP